MFYNTFYKIKIYHIKHNNYFKKYRGVLNGAKMVERNGSIPNLSQKF